MKRSTFGLDLAKRVFQVHSIDSITGELTRDKLKRTEVLKYFANREPGVIAMEACGSAHYANSAPEIVRSHALPAVSQLFSHNVTRGLIDVPLNRAASTYR